MQIIIGIGEYGISNKKDDSLKTFALASCVGITMYNPITSAAGMIHIALPDHQINGGSINKPGYYVSLGIPLLLQKMEKVFGCKKNGLIVQLYGGADSISNNDCFCIGRRNLEAITKLLTKMDLCYSLGGVGGKISRTIEMEVATGYIKISTQPIRI